MALTVITHANRRWPSKSIVVAALCWTLAACDRKQEVEKPEVRPVRTVTVEKRDMDRGVVLTGRVESANEASIGFRIGGRIQKRTVNVGDHIDGGQEVARLESQNEMNTLRTAQANLAAAEAALNEARNRFERQRTLLSQGWTTRALFDQAEKARSTAQAQVDSANAQLNAAEDLVGFTKLEADAPGVVTAVGAESGEVVQAGQMIVRLARKGGRDAVFDVPAQLLQKAPADALIEVRLSGDPTVKAIGRVREVSPQADPVTRTFQVKFGLDEPPEAMRLGATVIGTLQKGGDPIMEIPATSLTTVNQNPAVWIVDPSGLTVSLRNVVVARYDPETVTISEGLNIGEIIVTAGVQALHPGQKVRLLP